MSEALNQEPTEAAAAEAQAQAESELLRMIQADPKRAEEEIKKLRNENAQKINNGTRDDYKRLQELEQTYKQEQEAKLKEEGRYKELLEQQTEKINNLTAYEEKVKKYESYFETQLEDAKKGLSEGLIEVVNNSTGSPADKLALVSKLKSEMGQVTNSPGSDRPAGGATAGDVSTLVNQIKNEPDMRKRAGMIFEMKSRSDSIAKEVLTKI